MGENNGNRVSVGYYTWVTAKNVGENVFEIDIDAYYLIRDIQYIPDDTIYSLSKEISSILGNSQIKFNIIKGLTESYNVKNDLNVADFERFTKGNFNRGKFRYVLKYINDDIEYNIGDISKVLIYIRNFN